MLTVFGNHLDTNKIAVNKVSKVRIEKDQHKGASKNLDSPALDKITMF